MKIFWIILLSNLIAAILVLSLYNKCNPKKSNQCYYSSTVLSILFGGIFLIFLGGSYVVYTKEYGLLLALAIIGLPLLLFTIRCASLRISFHDDFWMFNRKKYLYSDITKIVLKKNGNYSIFVGRKKIAIDPIWVNYDIFTKMLKKQKVFKSAEVIRKK